MSMRFTPRSTARRRPLPRPVGRRSPDPMPGDPHSAEPHPVDRQVAADADRPRGRCVRAGRSSQSPLSGSRGTAQRARHMADAGSQVDPLARRLREKASATTSRTHHGQRLRRPAPRASRRCARARITRKSAGNGAVTQAASLSHPRPPDPNALPRQPGLRERWRDADRIHAPDAVEQVREAVRRADLDAVQGRSRTATQDAVSGQVATESCTPANAATGGPPKYSWYQACTAAWLVASQGRSARPPGFLRGAGPAPWSGRPGRRTPRRRP